MGELEQPIKHLALSDKARQEFQSVLTDLARYGNDLRTGLIDHTTYQKRISEAYSRLSASAFVELKSIQYSRILAKNTEFVKILNEFSKILRKSNLDEATINHVRIELMGGRFAERGQYFNVAKFINYLKELKINSDTISKIADILHPATELLNKINMLGKEYASLLLPSAILREVVPLTTGEMGIAEREATRLCGQRSPLQSLSEFLQTKRGKVAAATAAVITLSVLSYYFMNRSQNQQVLSAAQLTTYMRENVLTPTGQVRSPAFPIMPPNFNQESKKVWQYFVKLAERKDDTGKKALATLNHLVSIYRNTDYEMNRTNKDLGIIHYVYVLLRKQRKIGEGTYIDWNNKKFTITDPIDINALPLPSNLRSLNTALTSVSNYLNYDIKSKK